MWSDEPETPEEFVMRKQEVEGLIARSPVRAWALMMRMAGLTMPEIAHAMSRKPETVLAYIPRADGQSRGDRMDEAAMEARPTVCAHCGLPGVSSGSTWHSACVQHGRKSRARSYRKAVKDEWLSDLSRFRHLFVWSHDNCLRCGAVYGKEPRECSAGHRSTPDRWWRRL